jgi:hypothetical protein
MRARLWVLLVLGLPLAGCVKSYVMPLLPPVTYEDLLAAPSPRPVVFSLEFQRNGKATPSVSPTVRDKAVKILTTAKVFTAIGAEAAADTDTLKIVLDNVGDVGDAVGQGALTGLTFGAKGSTVTDGYVMTATFTRVGRAPVEKVYRHALVSTVGNASGPEGLTAMSVQEAFDRVLQDLVLNLLRDLQKAEAL